MGPLRSLRQKLLTAESAEEGRRGRRGIRRRLVLVLFHSSQSNHLPYARFASGNDGVRLPVMFRAAGGYNFGMRVLSVACLCLLLGGRLLAQEKAAPPVGTKSVTVPLTIDHNRIVINVDLRVPDGSMQTIRAWVDNGNAELDLSRRVATLLGLNVACGAQECSSAPPQEIVVGGMTIPLREVKEAKIPLKPVNAAAVLASGMNVEINIPSIVLRNYDVLVDFPEHKFTIGMPGTVHFRGSSGKVQVNAANGLIQVPSQIERKKYNLALDLGASISFLSEELFASLAAAHPDWPQMSGAVGSANVWGADEETKWKVMRVDRVQYGPLFLTNVPFVSFPKAFMDFFTKRAGIPTAGLLGADALQNYRVGLDYAHSTVYFDIGRLFNFPEFDVVGLVLRPEDDGRYAILGVPDFDGKPAVDGVQAGDHLVAVNDIPVQGSTMGQVWSILGGTPRQEKKLTVERGGKTFVVAANVEHFLGDVPDKKENKKKR